MITQAGREESEMPTNRKRKLRTSKRRIPANVTPEYIETLRARDFLGELSEEEIPVAKELKIYKWDAWCKKNRKGKAGE